MKPITDEQLNNFAQHIKDYGNLLEFSLGFNPADNYEFADFTAHKKLSKTGLEKTLGLIST